MIVNNENRNLTRSRKRGIERRRRVDDKMKSLIDKIKTEKKNKNCHTKRELEIILVKIKYVNNPDNLQSELKNLKKILVNDKNLHEIKQEILQGYEGFLAMVGSLKIGEHARQTHIRFRNIIDFES